MLIVVLAAAVTWVGLGWRVDHEQEVTRRHLRELVDWLREDARDALARPSSSEELYARIDKTIGGSQWQRRVIVWTARGRVVTRFPANSPEPLAWPSPDIPPEEIQQARTGEWGESRRKVSTFGQEVLYVSARIGPLQADGSPSGYVRVGQEMRSWNSHLLELMPPVLLAAGVAGIAAGLLNFLLTASIQRRAHRLSTSFEQPCRRPTNSTDLL